MDYNGIMFLTVLLFDERGLNKYKELIFDAYNPFYLSILIFFLILVLLYISYKFIYKPMLVKHRSEKEKLEYESTKLLALFSELDPNPIIRINSAGLIVNMNNSAKELINLKKNKKNRISEILSELNFNIRQAISENKSLQITQKLNGKIYEINFYGISFLEMAQLYFYDLTEKKEYEEQMNTYQKLLKDSTANLQKMLDQERNSFAGLLHDSIGQNLLLIKLGMNNYKKINFKNSENDEFNKTIDLLDSTITEIKQIAHSIKPLNLDELGLITVLTSMCRKVSKESGIKAQLQLPVTDTDLPAELEECIYRITQESLNNMIKHSKANVFNVSLNIDEDTAVLFISDDGIGFKPTKLLNDKYVSDGMGILNMQERVERIGGTFHIDSSHNNGTLIVAEFSIYKMREEAGHNYKNTFSGRP